MDILVSIPAPDSDRPIEVRGAIDVQSRVSLVEQVSAWMSRTQGVPLVLDLSGVTFIDSTGIGALIELSGDAEDAERGFEIVNPSTPVRRILEITGLATRWTVA